MDTYKETFETWDKVALLYQDKFMDLDFYDETYDFVCSTITKPNAKLLEIGCGPGNITKYLLNKRPDFDILGIDVAHNMIELAKQNNPTASFTVMDGRDIGQISLKYDGIICGFCMPYLSPSDIEKLFFDCSRLMNKDAVLYLSFVAGDSANSGFQVGSSGDRVYFHFHTMLEIKNLLTLNGFELLKEFEIEYKKSALETDIHTVIIAKYNV